MWSQTPDRQRPWGTRHRRPPPLTCKKGVRVKEGVTLCVYASICVPISRTAQSVQCSESTVVTFSNKKKNHSFSVINKQYIILTDTNKHIIWAYLTYIVNKCFCKQMVTCSLMMLLLDLSSYYMCSRTYFYHEKWTACSSWGLLFSW